MERLEDTATVWAFAGLSIMVLVIGILSSSKGGNVFGWVGILFVFMLGMILTLAISDATRSINKFRNGYDFDTSILEDSERHDDDRSPSMGNDH